MVPIDALTAHVAELESKNNSVIIVFNDITTLV